MTALLKAVGINDSKKLSEALSEVRRLDERRAEISAELDRRVDISYFDSRVEQSRQQYNESRSPEDLFQQLLAELVAKEARAKAYMASKERQYNGADDRFRREFPNFREVLAKACKLKLEAAKAEADRLLAQEVEKFGDEYGREEIADHSLPCRKANGTVQNLRFRLTQIESDLPQVCWQNHAASLLAE